MYQLGEIMAFRIFTKTVKFERNQKMPEAITTHYDRLLYSCMKEFLKLTG